MHTDRNINVNNSSNFTNTSASFSNLKEYQNQTNNKQESTSVPKKPYRDCMKTTPQHLPSLKKAPPAIMPRTHYAN